MTSTHPLIPRILEGRLAFVTGAGQGNGREIALGLSRAGVKGVAKAIRLPSSPTMPWPNVPSGGRRGTISIQLSIRLGIGTRTTFQSEFISQPALRCFRRVPATNR